MAKHKATDTKTEDSVIIDWGQIPQAPIKRRSNTVIKANLYPTVKYPINSNTAVVYHHGVCVKKVSRGFKRFR